MSLLSGLFKGTRKAVPGAVLDCTWTRVISSAYDPATGTNVDTSTTETFTAIRGEYRNIERVTGIQAGDCQLIIDSVSLSSMPPVGAVITWGGEAWRVEDAKDYAGLAYDLQMRRK